MREKKRVLKGIVVALILICNVLTSCISSFNSSLASETGNEEINAQEKKEFDQTEVISGTSFIDKLLYAASGITSIDLTGLAAGSDANHTHIYEKKYDATKHWEQCWICGAKRNEATHNITTVGTYHCNASYGNRKQYCTDGCGYNVTLPLRPHTASGWNTAVARYRHYKYCTAENCGHWVESERCKNAAGQILGCETGISGTCATCGYTYKNTNHGEITTNGLCEGCGKTMVTYTTEVTPLNENTTRVIWKITPLSGVTLDYDSASVGSCTGPHPVPNYNIVSKWKEGNTQCIQANVVMSNENGAVGIEVHSWGKYTYLGVTNSIHISANKVTYPDNNAPASISTNVIGNGAANNFSKKATLTAVFQDAWNSPNNMVYMRLLDKNGSTVISDWGAATRNGLNYTRTFDVVSEVREPANVYVQAKDACGNTSVMVPVTIQYIDAKAPVLVSQTGNTNTWAQSKNITYTVNDGGVGGASIAFNNNSDFQVAAQSGNNYSRTYNFYGDVYGSVTGALYIKDALGNIRTERVTISKLDGTAPTITGTSIKNNVITVTANDQRAGMGEGSGVASYRYIASNTKLNNPSITTSNSTLVTGKVTGTGTFTVNNISEANYVYVSAVDAVGNIGTAVEVPVPKLSLGNTIDLTAQDGKGGVKLTWTIANAADKVYSIYQQAEGETTWSKISDKTAGTTMTTATSKDIVEPNAPKVTVIGIENDKIKINQTATDNGSTYSFYAEAYDKTNTNILLSRSNQVTGTITTGVKGYYYVTDDNEENDFDIEKAKYVSGENFHGKCFKKRVL